MTLCLSLFDTMVNLDKNNHGCHVFFLMIAQLKIHCSGGSGVGQIPWISPQLKEVFIQHSMFIEARQE